MFSAADERWMAGRLEAFDAAQGAVAPLVREGNLPLCHHPEIEGLTENEDARPLPRNGGEDGCFARRRRR